MTIFGEWCGPGIQKGCAIHTIGEKIFAIFAMIGDVDTEFISQPDEIAGLLTYFLNKIPNTYVLPWQTEPVVIDWSSSLDEMEPIIDGLNKSVEEVEACDPWVKNIFGKEGIGEGLVYYPISPEHLGREKFSALAFKAKGEKHKVVKTNAPVVIDAAVANSVEEFVDLVVTDARLEQGVCEACNGEYELSKLGELMRWVNLDIIKECQLELEASNLTWKQIQKSVTTKIRLWYMAKYNS